MSAPRLNEYQEARAMREVADGLVLFPQRDPESTPLFRILLALAILAALPFLAGVDAYIDAEIAARDRPFALHQQLQEARSE